VEGWQLEPILKPSRDRAGDDLNRGLVGRVISFIESFLTEQEIGGKRIVPTPHGFS